MARQRYSHNSFSIGVLSEKVLGNTEFEGYNNALKSAVNFQVQHTGGLFKRGGTKFVAKAKKDNAKLILFSYSVADQYMCEFGEQYVRFHTRYGTVCKNGIGVGDPFELQTPFSYDEVKKIKHFQDGNTLLLITPKGMFKLSRTSSVSFEINEIFYTSPPMTLPNTEQIALKPTADSGEIYLKCVDPKDPSKKPASRYAPVFFDDDLDGFVTLIYVAVNSVTQTKEVQHFYLKILAVEDDADGFKKLKCNIDKERSHHSLEKLPSMDSVSRWAISAFTKTRGLPKAADFFEGRLFLANNLSYQTAIWGSATLYNDYTDFFQGASDADALAYRMCSQKSDEILWLASQGKLFAGTQYGIYIAGSATYNDEAITPSNFNIRLCARIGASDLQPITALDSIFFVDASGRNVHEIVLSAETGTYAANDLSLIGGDVTASGIIAHAWQQTPVKTYWCAVNDGHLCSLTYLKNNGITAWAKHKLAGDNVAVEDVCSMNGDTSDYLWMVVRRYIDGKYVRYIEYMMPAYDPLEQEEFKQFYVDCGVTKKEKYSVNSVSIGSGWSVAGKVDTIPFKPSEYYNVILRSGDETLGFFCNPTVDYDGKRTYLYKLHAGNQYSPISTVTSLQGKMYICKALWKNTEQKGTIHLDRAVDLKIGQTVYMFHYSYSYPFSYVIEKKISMRDYVLKDFNYPSIYVKALYLPLPEEVEIQYSANIITIDELANDERKSISVFLNKIPGMTTINDKKYTLVKKHGAEYYICSSDHGEPFALADLKNDTAFDSAATDGGNCYVYFTEVDGLDHLKGCKLVACADGDNNDAFSFDGAKVSFKQPVMYANIGLRYSAEFETVSLAGGSMFGSSVGLQGSQKTMFMHVYYSLGGQYGADKQHIVDIPYADFVSSFAKKRKLVSGILRCPIENSPDIYDRSICVEHDEPLAMNVLSITQDVQVSDG